MPKGVDFDHNFIHFMKRIRFHGCVSNEIIIFDQLDK